MLGQLKVDVTLVNLVATVTDTRGKYVEGLRAEDFTIREDDAVQTISHFEQTQDVPISVGILLDSSESMASKIKGATDAVSRFVRSIHKEDDVFLMTFDQRPALRQDFTDNREKLSDALKRVKLGFGTALYDAVAQGLKKIKDGKHDNRAILLITDGEDVSSFLSFEQAEARVQESQVLLYALGIKPEGNGSSPSTGPRLPTGPTLPGRIPFPFPGIPRGLVQGPQRGGYPGRDSVNMTVLNTLAEASGGKAWLVSNSKQIETALDEIALELRNQYTFGYYPPHPIKDGKWHNVDVETKSTRYTVRTRKSYFGG